MTTKAIREDVSIGPCRLILGDCREVMGDLDFDAIVSDPPYGINFQHSGGGRGGNLNNWIVKSRTDKIHGDESVPDLSHLFEACGKTKFASAVSAGRTAAKPLALMGANHFRKQIPDGGTWFTWDKSCGQGAAASFVDSEIGWHNRRNPRTMFRHFWMGALRTGRGNQGIRQRLHVSEKPEELMEWMMESARIGLGKTVLDPYMGSGTTGAACLMTGRKFIGIEIAPEHFRVAVDRLNKLWKAMNNPPRPLS